MQFTKIHFILIALFLVFFPDSIAQDNVLLSGRISDAITGSSLTGASVMVQGTGRGASSDTLGYYRIPVSRGQVHIQVAYLGYARIDTLLSITSEKIVDFFLFPTQIEYEEVRITADAAKDYISSVQMSEIQIKQEEISSLPAILGESDPIRFLQLTPGVQSSTEGGIGFFVRGGGVDQNLVLFDNTLIYNPGHLLGFLSVFNPDIISDVSLVKSGIPARYGGKLSSVVNVNADRGRSDSLRVKGQIGLVSSRISLNRSFNKDRGSFVVSARRASIDIFVKPLIIPLVKNSSSYFHESTYNFYDLNGSISHRIGKKDYLSLSAYYGKDKYQITRSSIGGASNLNWGNAMASLKWNHLFSDRLSLATSISHTSYDFDLKGAQADYLFSIISSVRDYTFKSHLNHISDNHRIVTGFELTRHAFTPNKIDVEAGNLIVDFMDFNKLYAYEGGLFAEDEFSLSARWSMSLGIRYSFFHHVGPYKEYIYDEFSQVKDSVIYPKGESLAFYHQLEPRASLKFQVNEVSSFKASYMHMAQYVHLATSATVSLPTDIWLPSSRNIRPQTGDQLSLGYFRNFFGNRFESSIEAYYKSSKNQIEFIRGVINNSLNQTLEENLAVGDGRSYGAEIFLRKKTGTFTGWVGYSLSRAERLFEKINDGKIYPSKFDRRHDLSLAGIYRLNKLWNLSAVFIYVSGNAFTLPVGRYIIQENLVNEYDEVNNFRMPPYHRLDLAATRSRITRKGNISSWNFSIYNVYNRANPFYIYFEATGNLDEYSLEIQPKMVSLFPIVPSLSWRFEF